MQEKAGAIRYAWADVKKEMLSQQIERKMIWGKNVMLSHIYLKRGGLVPVHHHENEQFSYVLEGSIRFFLGDDGAEEIVVHAGEVLHLPANLPHGAEALEDALSLDVFSPPRKDWIDGTDDYLRK